MVGHHEFKEGFARSQNFLRIGDDFHAGFDRANAGGGENARAGIHDAKAADANGGLVLKVAKRGYGDAVHARGIEDARAGGDADGLAVEGDANEARRCGCGRHTRGECRRAGLRRRARRR